MNVLVIGREGQLARALMDAAWPDGMRLTAVGRPDIDLVHADSIPRALDRAAPDLVINAAAYTAVDKAETEPLAAQAVNVLGPEVVARTCARLGVPLIHVSTDYVFDGSKDQPYTEDDPVAPLGVYGRSKLDGEVRIARACPGHVILRTAWVFSPDGHNFVKTMLRLAAARPEISVVDDQWGSPTYGPHLAQAMVGIAQRVHEAGGARDLAGVYNLAGSGAVTWCGLAREIFAVSSRLGGPVAQVRAIGTADYPTPARRPPNSRLDCSKAARVFATELPDWRLGVADCVTRLLASARST